MSSATRPHSAEPLSSNHAYDLDYSAYEKEVPEFTVAQRIAQESDVIILHFNDSYELNPVQEDGESIHGGYANARGLINYFAEYDPLVTFGGDAFGGGSVSAIFKGGNMVDGLNLMGVDVAVIGNHEFDYGAKNAAEKFELSEFPWLSTNLSFTDDQQATRIPTHDGILIERNGITLGIGGIVSDWVADGSCNPKNLETAEFQNEIESGQKVLGDLKELGADVSILIAHGSHDAALLQGSGADLVLGGHYHDPELTGAVANGDGGSEYQSFEKHTDPMKTLVARSGSDLETITLVGIKVGPDGEKTFEAVQLPILESLPDDPIMTAYVTHKEQEVAYLKSELTTLTEEMDARKTSIRSQQTSAGKFVTEPIRLAAGADIAIYNSGGIRSERIHPAGPFSYLDLADLLPFTNTIHVVKMKGTDVTAMLEYGLSYAGSGKYPQFSGVEYGSSVVNGKTVIDTATLVINGKPYSADGEYLVAANDFMSSGGDGYDMFLRGEEIQTPVTGMMWNDVLAAQYKP